MKKILLSTMTMAVMALSTFTANADFQINSQADLETFRNNVNNGTTYSGETVYLNVDIDLGGASWTPIANTTDTDGNGFQGTFDGKGHKISNFKCAISAKGTEINAIAGLFGLNRGTIKNLMVSGADCDANAQGDEMNSSAAGAIAGVNKGTINNCTITSSDIYAYIYYGAVGGYSHAGGIAGAQKGDDAQIVNCYIYDCTVKAEKRTKWWTTNEARSNTISNKWETTSTNTQTNCCTSNSDYLSSWRKGRVDAAIAYVNNFGGATAEPYWWDANGITPHVTYAFRVDNSQATISANATYDKVAIVNNVADTYTYNGNTYDIYPGNWGINVTTYPQGIATNGDDAGYYVLSATKGSIADYQDATSTSNNRYVRTQLINGVTTPNSYPTDATVLSYTTEHTGLYKLTLADHGVDAGVRSDAIIVTTPTKVANQFDMYPAGSDVVVEVYLEGHVGDWSSQDYGYYIGEITDQNGNVLATTNDATYTMPENGMDEEGNSTYSYETNRFLRKQQFTVTMPAGVTTLSYTTVAVIPSSVEGVVSEARVYGVDGRVVIEAVAECRVTVVDMAGRIVYNGKVSQGRNELSLDRGFYIVNGTKVIVR